MERKTVHALLLSLAVVAGGVMMTTDAHAQTNTERLMTTVDNTNSILSALEALAGAVADGFASVLAAIGMVQADTDAIMAELGHVESDLAAISSDVAGLDSNVAAISSDVAGIDSSVDDINSNLQSVQNDLQGLSGAVGGSAASFASLADTVNANQVAINSLTEKLDMISEAVGVVQTTVETQEDVDPAVSNMLHTDDTEQAIAVADFAGTVTKHPTDGVYEASNTFSCTGDVFVEKMTISSVNAVLGAGDAAATSKSTVTVEGFTLLEYIDTDGDGTSSNNFKREIVRDFDNRFLSTGAGIVIKGSTDQSADTDTAETFTTLTSTFADRNYLAYTNVTDPAADGTDQWFFTLQEYVALKSNKATVPLGFDQNTANAGMNATKAQLGTVELYTITVDWFAASSDTTCSISSAVETVSGLPNADRTVLVALNLDTESEEGPPTPFQPAMLDCNGEDTEITGISIQAGAIAGLNQFVEVTLTAGGEPAEVSFDDTNSADSDASDLPFRFSGSDLTVGGEGVGTLLLQVTYDTTQGNRLQG